MRGPWQGAQLRSKISAPSRTCAGVNAYSPAADTLTSASAAPNPLTHRIGTLRSLRQQREGPYRAAGRYVLQLVPRLVAIDAADARQHRDELLALVGERHRLRVDPGPGL